MTDRLTRKEVEKLREGTTPGPWWCEPEGTIRNDENGLPRYDLPRVVRAGPGMSIAKAHLQGGNDPDPGVANARLIAAAPSLAATAIALMDEVAEWRQRAIDRGEEAEKYFRLRGAEQSRAEAAEAEVAALKADVERLRGLAFTAYCEGYIAAGGAWQDDNGWAQSESYAALQEGRT